MRYNIQCITSRFIDANCYIIRKDNCNIIIDPCISVKELLKYGIKEVSAILVTHGHVDHIIFIEEVSKYYNCEVYFSKNCKEKIFNDQYNLSSMFSQPLNIKELNYKIIKDNDLLEFDSLIIKCIFTPGHSSCSMCFLIENDLFTGDTLFDRGIGRTDLYSGNILQMKESLNKLNKMNTNFDIYPGHGNSSNMENQIKYNYQFNSLIK
jgi:glyoxylase-like metal-dependent hydrolase (beta-lactamase superfamily II)